MELIQLIKKFGQPDAILDFNGNGTIHSAIWDFEESIELDKNGVKINGKNVLGDPLQLLQSTLENWKSNSDQIAAIGYLSYDFKNFIFPHIPFKSIKSKKPFFWFGKPSMIKHFDCISNIEPKLNTQNNYIKNKLTKSEYFNNLQIIKKYLSDGDIYQVNYTYPKMFRVYDNPLDIYLYLSWYIIPRRGFYLSNKSRSILSFSPEEFIKVYFDNNKKIIHTYPMKGTRPEGKDEFERRKNIDELKNSNKDRAEHLMIVDLLRNDLGKICEFDSIKVNNLYGIQTYESVHHMVSEIKGKLKNDINETDIFTALFPGGSITGAPKERAMQIIDQLESYNRDIYTGALGYITKSGEMDFNIAIRTINIENQNSTYPVGGGIVWDSDSQNEWDETQLKAEILEKLFQFKTLKLKTKLCKDF